MQKVKKEYDYFKKKDNCFVCDLFNDLFLENEFDFLMLNMFLALIFLFIFYLYKVDWEDTNSM